MIKLLINIILFIAFFGNTLEQYSIVPKFFSMLTEFSVYLLFLCSMLVAGIKKKGYSLHLIGLYFLLVLDAVISSVINERFEIQAILSFRYVLRFYLLYLAIINLSFSNEQIYKFNKLIAFLFIIQLPVQLIKFYLYGFSENTIGTYSTHGGGLTTVIPLVALGYLIAFYYLYEKKKIYLFLSAGFIAYGILGIKLALLFIYPVAFFSLYYLNVVKIRGFRIQSDIYKISFISILILIVSILCIKFQPRANQERIVGGSIDLGYTLEYAKKYTTGTRSGNSEIMKGRFATTKMTFKYLWEEGFIKLSLGYGPGILNKLIYHTLEKKYNSTIEKIGASYGKTGMVYIATEYGIIGMIILTIVYLIFIKNCFQLYKKEKEPYWKAFASGSLFFSSTALFIYIFYNTTTVIGGVIQPVFFYCMAIVYSRLKEN